MIVTGMMPSGEAANYTYAFHETVQGYMHILRNQPCEDASASYSSPDGSCQIAIIADGHGDKSCFRSSFGSKAAVQAAVDCLKEFADTALSSGDSEHSFRDRMIRDRQYRHTTVRSLTDSIISAWNEYIRRDYEDNPPSETEMRNLSKPIQQPAHIYGTTLIAALKIADLFILMQQGDGRCTVFYQNGAIDQPIPWDPRCEGSATTSLCDYDAADSFRSTIIDLMETPVIGCFLSSDGIEDSYRDTYEDLGGSHTKMSGVYTFCKELLVNMAEKSSDEFEEYLKESLPQFSAAGSSDDTSVAGIIYPDRIVRHIPQYKKDIRIYSLEEQLSMKETELSGKIRKHTILQKRREDAGKQFEVARSALQNSENNLNKMKSESVVISNQLAVAEENLQVYNREAYSVIAKFDSKYYEITSVVESFLNDLIAGCKAKEAEVISLKEEDESLNKRIKSAGEQAVSDKAIFDEVKNRYTAAKEAFSIYDLRFQEIQNEINQIKKEINKLNHQGAPDQSETTAMGKT